MAIAESELIIPSLAYFRRRGDEGASTSELLTFLRVTLKPSGGDLEILASRQDDHFSQKVRNLKSHDTFERLGVAEYREGRFYITKEGESYLRDNKDKHRFIRSHGFSDSQRRHVRSETLADIVVEEGAVSHIPRSSRSRSARLRKLAIRHYTRDGDIRCAACLFSYSGTYGELGEGFIEIHHIDPIAASEMQGRRRRLQEALDKVVPLCANCHRMVHRRDPMLNPDELRAIIDLAKGSSSE